MACLLDNTSRSKHSSNFSKKRTRADESSSHTAKHRRTLADSCEVESGSQDATLERILERPEQLEHASENDTPLLELLDLSQLDTTHELESRFRIIADRLLHDYLI